MQVITPTKDLTVVPVRSKCFHNLINFFRLLGLATPLTENDVSCDATCEIFQITFVANQTGLLCMLQIVPMAFGDFSINSLFNPSNFINKCISILIIKLESKSELGVDYPDKQEAISLESAKG